VSLSGLGLLITFGVLSTKPAADVAGNDANDAVDSQPSDFNTHALDGYATGAGPLKTQGASNDTVLRPQSVASVGTQRTWNHQQPDGTATV
ncbi:hypothetical protein J8J20_22330, partial [Mycobacterium tuberculosis]|nr:hypothetical protein [Mycobacterium tuberculosis]